MRGERKFRRYFLIPAVLVAAGYPGPADAGIARCFLHGIITPKLDTREKTSLSDMIRLRFDVSKPEDKSKCEQMMEAYCAHNVKAKDYSPVRLRGSFKPDVDKSDETSYRFTESCRLESD